MASPLVTRVERNTTMVKKDDTPADLTSFRSRREELKRERRRLKARDNLHPTVPDYGREVPPGINPDVPDMVDQVKVCYVDLEQWIAGFEDEIVALVEAHKLNPGERERLVEHYRDLQEAVDAATAQTLEWSPTAGSRVHAETLRPSTDFVYRLADHAKYVYAVGARDIAAMQYRLSELAGAGRLEPEAHKRLQWQYCLPMWETLYHGTVCAVRDERTWDGGWDWSDNTYSDGRQVMAQMRVKNWQDLNDAWPYRSGLCGDGPIQEHPRGSFCQIYPVVEGDAHHRSHPALEVDPVELLEQLSLRTPSHDSDVYGDDDKFNCPCHGNDTIPDRPRLADVTPHPFTG